MVARESASSSKSWRDPAAWATVVDVFVILIAVSLPWSTSLVAIFAVAFLVATAPFIDISDFVRSVKRPICVLPLALFALAVAGTLWSDAPWGTRLHAVGPTVKLLMLPVLFYHFERTERGLWVLIAFLASCTLLAAMSWIVVFDPHLSLKPVAGLPDHKSVADAENPAGGVADRDRRWLRRQYGLRDRFADRIGHGADHARGVCVASPEMAQHRHHSLRDSGIRGSSMADVSAVALDRTA